ncbi:acyl-CoA thioesterase, partial [Streptomyces sp. NPDC051563]|uniref:acyl-CoA thioesterase n=1 Tax=Streptomyces sp. NPDC051563 TaxID=3365659 RepID=UPI00379D4668
SRPSTSPSTDASPTTESEPTNQPSYTENFTDPLSKNFFLSEQWMKFSKPLVYSKELVEIEVWVTSLKGVSFELAYEIKDSGGVYVSATSKMAGFDSVAGRVRRFDDDERAVLGSFLDGS